MANQKRLAMNDQAENSAPASFDYHQLLGFTRSFVSALDWLHRRALRVKKLIISNRFNSLSGTATKGMSAVEMGIHKTPNH